jgi:predicted GNAT superfamily acetyltransferase
VVFRRLETFDDLSKVEAVEREVWGLKDNDVIPITAIVATQAAGAIWVGAFDGPKMVGFAFGFLGLESGHLMIHSHMLAVLPSHRDSDVGVRLKLAQREQALAMGVRRMTWTFDPLQSKNAHLNFSKLGVVSASYRCDFYGPQTSSTLHQNGTDRLWVTWPLTSRRVQRRMQSADSRAEVLDVLSRLAPLVRFNGDGKPACTDLSDALSRQRIAIEIPSDILSVEQEDFGLAREWRMATRWAFTEALQAAFLVVDFCRDVRGKQGPGTYLLEKSSLSEYVPELSQAG